MKKIMPSDINFNEIIHNQILLLMIIMIEQKHTSIDHSKYMLNKIKITWSEASFLEEILSNSRNMNLEISACLFGR